MLPLRTNRLVEMLRCLLFFCCLFGVTTAQAQWPGWQAHTSMREAMDLDTSDDALWAATSGGVFRYDFATGDIRRFTTVEGLNGIDARALVYDEARDVVWIGYSGGVLDRLDVSDGTVRSFFDIARANQFTARGIRTLVVQGDSLLVGTDFGLVIFDPIREEVRDGISRFGTLEAALPVRDVIVAPLPDGRSGFWLATPQGIAYAPLHHPNLREPGAWTVERTGLPSTDVYALANFDGVLWAGTNAGAATRQASGAWAVVEHFTPARVSAFTVSSDKLIAIDPFYWRVVYRDGTRRYLGTNFIDLRDVIVGPDGAVWTADAREGVARFTTIPEVDVNPLEPTQHVVPEGPFNNFFAELDFDAEGRLWVAGASGDDFGFYRFDPETSDWTNYTPRTTPALGGRRFFDRIHIAPDGSVWAGSVGSGLVRVTPEEEFQLFDQSNSPLQPAPNFPDYIRVGGIGSEADGTVWITNQQAAPPLVFYRDGEWGSLPVVSEPGLSGNDVYNKLFVDSYGQKWITIMRQRGLVVLDTRGTPGNPSDDRHAYLPSAGSGGVGLPNELVNAVTEDRSGRVWIGTARGIAFFFAPSLVTSGDPNAALPVWPRSANSESFFLRDLYVNDIAVDPADRKWIASQTGAWLTNAEGNEVMMHLTRDNTPFFSNNITAIAVDERTGRVYFATDRGLLSYAGDAVAPARTVQDLFVFPNPVRFHQGHDRVTIDGLVDQTDLRILSVDGQVVASFETRGGRVTWDGRDPSGQPVPTGVYVVVAVGQNGEGAAYGKIAVIR